MTTYQQINNSLQDPKSAFEKRVSLIHEIEAFTQRPLIIYVAKLDAPREAPNSIDIGDITAFSDLIEPITGDNLDVLIQSPGGQAEATERIVQLLRSRFKNIRFLVPHSAYSAATLLAMSGNCIYMDDRSTLGPIDPQLSGIPTRAILQGFNEVKKILKKEGPEALPAYLPLIQKYDIHIFEICKNAEKLSKELAEEWLRKYMFTGDGQGKRKAKKIVKFFSDHGLHKSHSRTVGIQKALDLNLNILDGRQNKVLRDKLWELHCIIEWFFNKSPFIKLYENGRGVNWGKQFSSQIVQLVPQSQKHEG